VLSCEGCHGPATTPGIPPLRAAGDWTVISRAITANTGGMGALAYPVMTGYDMQDIAAFLANPSQ
jgi:mono/diheme cytochrome c family protein